MQRGIITDIESSSIIRATNLLADETWLVTFDTELEFNAERTNHLICRQVDGGVFTTGAHRGDPQARGLYK